MDRPSRRRISGLAKFFVAAVIHQEIYGCHRILTFDQPLCILSKYSRYDTRQSLRTMMDVEKWLDKQCDLIKVGLLQFVLHCNCFTLLFYRHLWKPYVNFSQKITVSRDLAEKYKSRQNMANPNISRILGLAGFVSLKIRLWSLASICRYTQSE